MAGRARKKREVKAKANTAPIIPDRPVELEAFGQRNRKRDFEGIAIFRRGLAGDLSRQQCLERIPEKVSVEVARFPPDLIRPGEENLASR